MPTPIPGWQAPNGLWVCQNGPSIAIADTEEKAFRQVMDHKGFSLPWQAVDALAEYFKQVPKYNEVSIPPRD